jgi:hypothetical protein
MVKLNKEKNKVKESCYILMVEYIKVNGKIIINKEKVIKNLLMVLFIMVHILKVNHMVMVNINGKMEKYIKVNG